MEPLDPRLLLSVSASFSTRAGVLSVFGDSAANNIVLFRDPVGHIFVTNNGAAVPVRGNAVPTVFNTTLIHVSGGAGDDQITLDETNGALPSANLFGGAGNDTLTGGSGNDQLSGQAGDDVLFGKGGNDLLFGGAGNDILTGGKGNDSVFGQAGNDRMIWNNGDGSDVNEGGAGIDTVEVNGGDASEIFTIAAAAGGRVRFDRTNLVPFFIDIGTSENLVLNANGGDDTITAGNGLANLISLTLNGGDGNDTITGSDGADRITGGDGNDVIIGGKGNDALFGGAGDDTFIWNNGDGSDLVEGEDGADTLQFNGAAANENFALSANGTRLRFTRDLGNINMDVNGVETVNVAAEGGADTLTVNDLTGTDVTTVNADLAATPGSGTGDGAVDSIIVNGTPGDDAISVSGAAGSVDILGLQADIHITGAEPTDRLTIASQAGDDSIDAQGLAAGTIQLTEDGGDGDDHLVGSPDIDTLLGGNGDDILASGPGLDSLDGGTGDNVLIQ
jgi:Ca2+-binding RTX toxin-like protein